MHHKYNILKVVNLKMKQGSKWKKYWNKRCDGDIIAYVALWGIGIILFNCEVGIFSHCYAVISSCISLVSEYLYLINILVFIAIAYSYIACMWFYLRVTAILDYTNLCSSSSALNNVVASKYATICYNMLLQIGWTESYAVFRDWQFRHYPHQGTTKWEISQHKLSMYHALSHKSGLKPDVSRVWVYR